MSLAAFLKHSFSQRAQCCNDQRKVLMIKRKTFECHAKYASWSFFLGRTVRFRDIMSVFATTSETVEGGLMSYGQYIGITDFHAATLQTHSVWQDVEQVSDPDTPDGGQRLVGGHGGRVPWLPQWPSSGASSGAYGFWHYMSAITCICIVSYVFRRRTKWAKRSAPWAEALKPHPSHLSWSLIYTGWFINKLSRLIRLYLNETRPAVSVPYQQGATKRDE